MRKWIFVLVALNVCNLFAEVKPARVFTDHAVLQQGEPVRIWGTAEPGEEVTVSFAGQIKTAKTDAGGRWLVVLDPMPVSADPRAMTIHSSLDTRHQTLSDILVGEVWLAGGQSNMQTTMGRYKPTTQADIDVANDPLLRMVTIPGNYYPGHSTAVPQWSATTPQTVSGFSASAYYFARNLRAALNVPVGIVSCSVGGTQAEAWMSRKTLESDPDLKRIVEAYDEIYSRFPDEEHIRLYDEFLAKDREWKRRRGAGEDAGPRPGRPMGPRNQQRPCGLHENMLTQTIPYTVKGAIWYQGESNAISQNSYQYRNVFSTLIKEWREEFRNKNMPFLFVQLATLGPLDNTSPYWPELCDAQRWVEDHVKNTGMIVLSDGGDIKDIHPHSKDKVGCRLSLLARNMVYGEKDLVCRGPRLKKAKVQDGAVELTFKNVGSGLMLKPEETTAFEICGEDGSFVPAKAELMNGKIVVSAEGVESPKYVRYGWKQYYVPTIYNAEGLPASMFRTDDFPLVSKDRFYLDNVK